MIENPILAGSLCWRLCRRIVDFRLSLGICAAGEDIPAESDEDEDRHEEEAEAEDEQDPVDSVGGFPG